MIDVAGADLLLHLREALQIGGLVPREGDVGEKIGAATRVGGEPVLDLRAGHLHRRLIEPEPQERHIAIRRHEAGKLRFKHVAKLVGEEACCM